MRKMIIESANKVTIPSVRGKKGIEITFSINQVIEAEFVYLEMGGENKYFQIQGVYADANSLNLTYKAFESGYIYDRLSRTEFFDIRYLIGKELFVVKDEAKANEIATLSKIT